MYACSSAGNHKNYTVTVVDSCVKCEILTPVNSMATGLWDVIPSSLVQYKLRVLV